MHQRRLQAVTDNLDGLHLAFCDCDNAQNDRGALKPLQQSQIVMTMGVFQ